MICTITNMLSVLDFKDFKWIKVRLAVSSQSDSRLSVVVE